ncbi:MULTISPECIES: hypothetical protein [unclassified Streptomyces]|uniref:hypothetical protein n=1 Tax=unclassified Streptomyces TaxID=2593676 RepID=UPI0021AC2CC4|nr:hypothetical protein [Streptomyces sp. PsTaAH-137]
MLTVASAVTSLALTACAQSDPGGGSVDRETAYKRVLNDPHPNPDAVIKAAGAPVGVARAGDGSLLLSYNVRYFGNDEGPAAAAWRIVSPAGRTVAQQAWHASLERLPDQYNGVRDGFVRWTRSGRGKESVYALDVRGKRHKVTTSDRARGTRPGDIVLHEGMPARFYRPANRIMAAPAGAPDYVDFALDERGSVWFVDQSQKPNRVVQQRDGRTLTSTPMPKPYTYGGAVTAAGGTAALFLLHGGPNGTTRGLAVTADDGAHWRSLTGGGVPWQDLKPDVALLELRALPDGRLLVGEKGGRLWVGDDRSNRVFHELKTPVPFTSVTVQGKTLYGIADATKPTYDLVKGEGLYASDDDGRTWRRQGKRG